MMEPERKFTEFELNALMQSCLYPPEFVNESESVEFREQVKVKLKGVIESLISYKTNNMDLWLLHSRAIVVLLFYCLNNTEKLFNLVQNSWDLSKTNGYFEIPDVKTFSIPANLYLTFSTAVNYGFLHLLTMKQELFAENCFVTFYRHLFANCRTQNRYKHVYFKMISYFVQLFFSVLPLPEFELLFQLCFYNMEQKDACGLMSFCIMHSPELDSEAVATRLLREVSWRQKYKYQILALIYEWSPVPFHFPHQEVATNLMFAQSQPYLAAAAAKLYAKLIKNMHIEVWFEFYYPEFEKKFIGGDNLSLCQKNVLKNYIPTTFLAHDSYFDSFLQRLRSVKGVSVHMFLNCVLFGVRKHYLKRDYDFTPFVNLGIDGPNAQTRSVALEIALLTLQPLSVTALSKFRTFLILNVNGADQIARESLKRLMDHYLCRLQAAITNANCLPSDTKHAFVFINWMFNFILSNFNEASCYRRLATSFVLLDVMLKYFSRNMAQQCNSREKLDEFLSRIDFFNNVPYRIHKLLDVFKFCDKIYKTKALEIIFSEISPADLQTSVSLPKLMKQAKVLINSVDVDDAEMGFCFCEFVIRSLAALESKDLRVELDIFQESMNNQWIKLKNVSAENVVCQNMSFHAMITLSINILDKSEPIDYCFFLNIIDDVIEHLSKVFSLRAMLPFDGQYCRGIAAAFLNTASPFHANSVQCMWMVLKESCRFLSKLAHKIQLDRVTSRILGMFSKVIKQCNHKGVLEMAGEALVEIVRNATGSGYSEKIIFDFTRNVLVAIPQTTQTISVLRRAGETSILLAALSNSDNRFNKPLFHFVVRFLMLQLKNCVNNMNTVPNNALHSLVLHCLDAIMADSSVDYHASEYNSDFAILVMKSFNTDDWDLNNAASQAFSTVMSKLLGSNIKPSDEDVQHRAVCLEEMLYKYPEIDSYLVETLEERRNDTVEGIKLLTPVFSIIELANLRHSSLASVEIQNKITAFRVILSAYVDYYDEIPLSTFRMLFRAYTNILPFTAIKDAICAVIEMFNANPVDEFFHPALYIIKRLSDKVFNEDKYLPVNYTLQITEVVLPFLASIRAGDNLLQSLIGETLLLHNCKFLCPTEIFCSNLNYICSDNRIRRFIPAIWTWLEKQMVEIIKYGDVNAMDEFFDTCLMADTPAQFKLIFLQTLTCRISQSSNLEEVHERYLVRGLFDFAFSEEYIQNHAIMEKWVKLILHLNHHLINTEHFRNVLQSIELFISGTIPIFYAPIYCSIFKIYTIPNARVKQLFQFCTIMCHQFLDVEKMDYLLFKSLLYITKYASVNRYPEMLADAFRAVYKLLQIGNEKLNWECSKIISSAFEKSQMDSFANIKILVNPHCLIPLIGDTLTLKYLIMIFLQQSDAAQTIEEENIQIRSTKAIDTRILGYQIFNSIKNLFLQSPDVTKNQVRAWFMACPFAVPEGKYTKVLQHIFNSQEEEQSSTSSEETSSEELISNSSTDLEDDVIILFDHSLDSVDRNGSQAI